MPRLSKRRTRRRRTLKRRGRRFPGIFRGRFGGKNLNYRGVHYFKRTVNEAGSTTNFQIDGTVMQRSNTNTTLNFVSNNTAGGQISYGTAYVYFMLSSLPAYTEYTALFDSFRIRKIVMKFTPYNTQSLSDPGTGGTYGGIDVIMHHAIDHDGANAPTASEAGIQDLQQYVSYKTHRWLNRTRPISVVIKPKAQIQMSQGISSVQGEARRSQWIDCAYPAIPHYGWRCVFEALNPNNNTQALPVRVETTYYIQFRGPR